MADKTPKTTKAPEISDLVETGPIHVRNDGSMAVEQDNRRISKVSANPLYEYVSGGSYAWTANYLRSLPWWIDDTTRDFGDDLYERMMLDPQVASCVDTVKLGVLQHGYRAVPPVDEDHPDFEQAKAIADFCQANLDELDSPPFLQVAFNLLDALALGNKVAEQIYELRDYRPQDGKAQQRLMLKMLKVKPRRSYAFIIDVYLNTVGLLGVIPGQGAPVLLEGMIGTPDQVPNLLPKNKFLILTHRKKDGDPRGSSILRRVYNSWYLKTQTWGEYLRYLSCYATPSLVGTTPEHAQDQPKLDGQGNIVLDASGNPIDQNPEQAMLLALQAFRNNSAVVVPFGATVEPIAVPNRGEAFKTAIDTYNAEIAKGILCQTLATEQAEHQARAAAETHQDVLGMTVEFPRSMLEECISRDVFRNLVRYNFGEQALNLTPRCSFGQTDQQDIPTLLTALAGAGYTLDTSQFRKIDNDINMPERADDWERRVEQDRQMQQQAAQAKPGQQPEGKGK